MRPSDAGVSRERSRPLRRESRFRSAGARSSSRPSRPRRLEVDFQAGRSRSLATGMRAQAGRSRSLATGMRSHAGRSRSPAMGTRSHAGRSRSLAMGMRSHAGRSRSLAMGSRFTVVETRFHPGKSGSRPRECREPVKPSEPPPIALGLPAIGPGAFAISLGVQAIAPGFPAITPGVPEISSPLCDDPSRPPAIRPRGVPAPCVSPRLAKGLLRDSLEADGLAPPVHALDQVRSVGSYRGPFG
jgi:hypothetical protein